MTTTARAVALVVVVLAVAVGCTSDERDPTPIASAETHGSDNVGSSSVPQASTTTASPRDLATTEDGLALPEGEEPEVLGPLGQSTVEIETGAGVVEIGAGTVPELIPAGFPIPDDFVVELTSSTADDAGFSGRSQETFEDLIAFYTTELASLGFDVIEQRVVADTLAVYDFVGPAGTGSVAISGAPGGGNSVLVTFER